MLESVSPLNFDLKIKRLLKFAGSPIAFGSYSMCEKHTSPMPMPCKFLLSQVETDLGLLMIKCEYRDKGKFCDHSE